MSAAAVARQTTTTQAAEDEEETSFVDLEVITKHGITKTDINKFKEAGFHTVSWRNQSSNHFVAIETNPSIMSYNDLQFADWELSNGTQKNSPSNQGDRFQCTLSLSPAWRFFMPRVLRRRSWRRLVLYLNFRLILCKKNRCDDFNFWRAWQVLEVITFSLHSYIIVPWFCILLDVFDSLFLNVISK